MLSAPEATTISAFSVWISIAPLQIDCTPPQQRRSTVMPGTSTGQPASSKALRARFGVSPLA
jgi:hypothetical protein